MSYKGKEKMKKLKVYLAGPFFNEEQVNRVAEIEKILTEEGFDMFSPRLESFLKPDATRKDRKKTFESNVKNIDDADFLIAIYDGKDTGTMFECGYAYAKNKPILYFAETLNGKLFNLMLAESTPLTPCLSMRELRYSLMNIRDFGLKKALMHGYGYQGLIE